MSQRPSGAANTGYVLVTLLLALVLAVGVFAVVNTSVALARDGHALIGGRTLEVDAELPPERVSLPSEVRLKGWPKVTLRIDSPTSKQILLATELKAGTWLLAVLALLLLRGLARSVRRGDPFGAANVRRLRQLGFLFVLGAPLIEVTNMMFRASLQNSLPTDRFGEVGFHGFSLPGWALLVGLGAFVLAEVFAHGLRLREDVEATI